MRVEEREGKLFIRPTCRCSECRGWSSYYAQSATVTNIFTGDGQNVEATEDFNFEESQLKRKPHRPGPKLNAKKLHVSVMQEVWQSRLLYTFSKQNKWTDRGPPRTVSQTAGTSVTKNWFSSGKWNGFINHEDFFPNNLAAGQSSQTRTNT